jgi:quercetin dioxygenase-like cupin family protein
MKICKYTKLLKTPETCCARTTVRQLLTPEGDYRQCEIKLFEMQPDGYSPLHKHPSEHKVLIIEGEGIVFDGKKEASIQSGDVIWTGTNEPHQIKATGKEPLKFIALTIDIEE